MKNRQPLVFFSLALGIILFIGIFCYTMLEIVPGTRWEVPSREVRANRYFALDKWLKESGFPVRTLSMGNINTILRGPEQTIFVEMSRINWAGDTEPIIPWLRAGGRLIVSLDSYAGISLAAFMESLGVMANSFDGYDEEDYSAENADDTEGNVYFDSQVSFKITGQKIPADRTLVMNSYGETKLVKLTMGKGWIVFTGNTYFLHNYSLLGEKNANLAAELFFNGEEANSNTGGALDNRGILFIRALSGERHMLGNLAERGNPAALAASLVLLIAAGFWMVIPSFGRFKPDPEKPGKPLRERFLAEGRFLKKYHSLGKYIEMYEKELELRSRSKGICREIQQTQEIQPAVTKKVTFEQFIKEQKIVMEQLEDLNKTVKGNL